MKKASSRVRIRSSRANGALSRGPKTPEGKLRSSRNRLTHGLYSNQILLETESPERFAELLQNHLDDFRPRNTLEREAVIDIAVTRWRIRRLWAVEAGLFSRALGRDHASYKTQWKLLEALPAVNRLSIIEDRYLRQLDADLRAFRTLRKLTAPKNKNFAHSNPLDEILIPGSTQTISVACKDSKGQNSRRRRRENRDSSPPNNPGTTPKRPDSEPFCENPESNSS